MTESERLARAVRLVTVAMVIGVVCLYAVAVWAFVRFAVATFAGLR